MLSQFPRHLEKARCRYNQPPEETDRINQSLTCILPAAILFFRSLRPSSYRIRKDRNGESFQVWPKYEAVAGWRDGLLKKEWGGIRKEKTLTGNGGVTVCPPCFEPAVLAGLSFFFKVLEKKLPKNKDVFWSVGEPQYKERINPYLTCISSAAILFSWFLCTLGRITKTGSCEEFS